MKQFYGQMPQYTYADFYVSTEGCDSWSGRLSQPNADRTDGPFRTVERARDALRLASFRQYRDMYVLIRGGEYRLNKTVVFDGRDSHYSAYHTVYAAYPGEKPVFSSDTELTGWRLAEHVPGLPACAEGKVYEADLPALPAGRERFFTLYEDGEMLTRAKSAGMEPAEVIHCLPYFDANTVLNADRQSLHYQGDVFRSWDNPEDAEVFIIPSRGFVSNYLPVDGIDTEKHIIHTSIPATYTMGKVNAQTLAVDGGTFRVENVIDFLTQPGYWTLDTNKRKVYYYPRHGKPGRVTFPALTEYFRVDGHERGETVRGVVFEGLQFTRGDRDALQPEDIGIQHDWDLWNKGNAMVRFRDAEDCGLRSCRLYNSGSAGVRMDLACRHNIIRDNLIEFVGGTGVLACGYGAGNRRDNGCNQIVNNHIHHCGMLIYASSAIMLWQSGDNIVRNNLLHHVAYDAIVIAGVRISSYNVRGALRENTGTIRRSEIDDAAQFRTIRPLSNEDINEQWHMVTPYAASCNNLIEDNEIFMAMQSLFDGNAIYISDVGNGNRIHRNYIHHLNGKGMQQAIRTDAAVQGTEISDNIIYNCVGGGINTKHFENHTCNNILADVRDIVYRDTDGTEKRQFIGYIALLEVLRDRMPANASLRVQRNIFYKTGTHQPFYREKMVDGKLIEGNLEDTDIDWNLYYDVQNPQAGEKRLETYRARGVDHHSVAADPLFEDLHRGNFRLKPDSPALALGFRQIPMETIGLTGAFPREYEEIVRLELGDRYGDFEYLESLCGSCDSDSLPLELVNQI